MLAELKLSQGRAKRLCLLKGFNLGHECLHHPILRRQRSWKQHRREQYKIIG